MCGLIEGLPDDIALRCLACVPYHLYPTLELVSSTWRAAVRSPDLFKVRQEVRSPEELLCLCAFHPMNQWQLYDPLSDSWIALPVLPSKIGRLSDFGTVFTSGKLYVLGGSGDEIEPSTGCLHYKCGTDEVWSFDFITRQWTQQAPMLVPRSLFACCIMDGKIVVAGGCTTHGNSVPQAEIYDPEKNVWVPIADLHHTHKLICFGLAIKGKVHVLYHMLSIVQILDPVKLDWTVEDYGWLEGPMAVVQDVLYMVGFGPTPIFSQEGESRKVVRSESESKREFLFDMTGIGEDLYVIGGVSRPDRNKWEIYIDALTVGTDRPAAWREVAPSRCCGMVLGYTGVRI